MNINDFIPYKFTCKMSKDYRDNFSYDENEFEVTFEENTDYDCGYEVIVVGTDNCVGYDGMIAVKRIGFGNWDVIKKEKRI